MNGQDFKSLRLKKGYTQLELSNLIGLSIVQISKIENDKVEEIKKSHILALKGLKSNPNQRFCKHR